MERVTVAGWAVGVLMMTLCGLAQAQVQRLIRFESVPPGAEVSLLTGADSTPIGTTPLRYAADFHSEQSILRFGIVRPGYRETTLEVTPALDHIVAKLEAEPLIASSGSQTDASLRLLHERWAPVIDNTVRASLAQSSGIRSDGLTTLQRVHGMVLVITSVQLADASTHPVNRAEAEAMTRKLWNGFGSPLVDRLRQALPAKAGIDGVLINASVSAAGPGFSVNSQVESRTELTCIPGSRMVYSACATTQPTYETSCSNGVCSTRPNGTRCAGGMVAQYDQCATRAPLTKYAVAADPKILAQRAGDSVIALGSLRFSFKEASPAPVLVYREMGERVLFQQGDLPAELEAQSQRSGR